MLHDCRLETTGSKINVSLICRPSEIVYFRLD